MFLLTESRRGGGGRQPFFSQLRGVRPGDYFFQTYDVGVGVGGGGGNHIFSPQGVGGGEHFFSDLHVVTVCMDGGGKHFLHLRGRPGRGAGSQPFF